METKIITKKQEHLHYLKVLRECGGVYQKEIRDALDYAIQRIEK